MAVKPGSTRKGPTGATLVWTGRSWVNQPRSRLEQIALAKRIDEMNNPSVASRAARGVGNIAGAFTRRAGNVVSKIQGQPTRGPQRKPDAERSWKSRSAQSGTVALAIRNAGGPSAPASKGSRTATSGTVTSAMSSAKAKSPSKTPKDKKPSGPSSSASSSSSRKSVSKATAAGGGRKPAVSQSNTMWVKKGTMVNGETVKKGYLAQYGKPEKRVTANVRAVKGNAAGMKAGSVTQYKGGRKVKKGK